jgi:hypothetical protein
MGTNGEPVRLHELDAGPWDNSNNRAVTSWRTSCFFFLAGLCDTKFWICVLLELELSFGDSFEVWATRGWAGSQGPTREDH